MRAIQNQTKIVQFEDNYLQAYFPDGTSIAWINDSITYYSLKGNRIKLSIQTLHLSQDASQKITKVVECQNRFNDDYIQLPKDMRGSIKTVFKKYKVKEFAWNNPIIRPTDQGYEVVSDDNNARFWLSKDLYRVNLEYLQLTSNRQVSKEQLFLGTKNQRKLLLQKYSYKYNEFPTSGCINQIQYQYQLLTKQFTIFNLPPRWCPPIKLIWGYLLSNQIIPHPFCYIDFSDPDNKLLSSIQDSKMPPFKCFEDYKKHQEEDKALQASSYPLYGKPNHNFKLKWMYIFQAQIDLVGYACQQNNIICEKEGFWFIEGTKVTYNNKNKDKTEYQVCLNAFPITIRFQNQTPRQLKPHILAFNSYLQHRDFLIQKEKAKTIKKVINSDEDIIHEQIIEGVGHFKAFKNHMAKCNFYDRVIITLRENQIKVIDELGKCWIVGSDPVLNSRFGWHIDKISNFHQKVFDSQAYQSRMQLNDYLEQRKQLSNVFMQVTKHIQSNDY